MVDKNTTNSPVYSLLQLVTYFLKLGYSGFGGPVALVGYMQRDLVEKKMWISEEDFKEGLALAQLSPGPMAAQLGIYLGFLHYGVIGAALIGLAFVLPSFIMVVLLGVVYKNYGELAWIQNIFYGIGAAVVGIIVVSSYKLTTKTISNFEFNKIKENLWLWFFYLAAAIFTFVTHSEKVGLFILAGMIYMFVKAPPQVNKTQNLNFFLLAGMSFCTTQSDKLGQIAWFFTKAGAFVFGSGLAIVPFLHSGVVDQYNWLNEKQFLDAVAVAMITPGPVVITVGFIGYLVAGFSGACIAALATFLPCFLLTVIPAPHFKKISKNKSIKAFVDGITAAVIGSLVGAVIIIAQDTIGDIYTAIIAVLTILVLVYSKKIQEPQIILVAAAVGLFLKSI